VEGDVQGVLSAHVNVLEGIEGALQGINSAGPEVRGDCGCEFGKEGSFPPMLMFWRALNGLCEELIFRSICCTRMYGDCGSDMVE